MARSVFLEKCSFLQTCLSHTSSPINPSSYILLHAILTALVVSPSHNIVLITLLPISPRPFSSRVPITVISFVAFSLQLSPPYCRPSPNPLISYFIQLYYSTHLSNVSHFRYIQLLLHRSLLLCLFSHLSPCFAPRSIFRLNYRFVMLPLTQTLSFL